VQRNTWREALALGLQPHTLSRWASSGKVRVRGERQDRRYLLRDIAVRMVASRTNSDGSCMNATGRESMES
jgi:predicted site-specific integrase-resolvase